jgi:hypothetical protein
LSVLPPTLVFPSPSIPSLYSTFRAATISGVCLPFHPLGLNAAGSSWSHLTSSRPLTATVSPVPVLPQKKKARFRAALISCPFFLLLEVHCIHHLF